MVERKKDPAKVQLKNVRLSFADIYRAKAFGGGRSDDSGEPKFSANFLIDPETREGKVNIEKMEDAIDEVLKSTDWGGKTPRLPEAKLPLRDGENHDYDGYEGMMFVSASNSKKPRILDADKLDVTEGDDGAPYSGCYVDAIVRVWGQNNKWGKRINASLEGIRFRDDGDAFGAAPLDPDEFDDDDDDRGSRRSSRSRGRDDDGDDDRSSRRRGRSSDDDDGDDRGSRRRGRSSEDDDDGDRRSSRSRGRDEEDDDDRGSRRRSRDRDEDGDDDRGSRRRSRDDDDDSSDDDDRGSRRRSRDEDDEPRSRRSRDDGERRSSRRRGRDDDDLS